MERTKCLRASLAHLRIAQDGSTKQPKTTPTRQRNTHISIMRGPRAASGAKLRADATHCSKPIPRWDLATATWDLTGSAIHISGALRAVSTHQGSWIARTLWSAKHTTTIRKIKTLRQSKKYISRLMNEILHHFKNAKAHNLLHRKAPHPLFNVENCVGCCRISSSDHF